MKLVLAFLSAWNVGQSQFKHCGGAVCSLYKLGYSSVRSPKLFKPLWRSGDARTQTFRSREDRIKPFQPLWTSCEASTSLSKCLESTINPFQAPWRCGAVPSNRFSIRKVPQSHLNHSRGPA